MDDVPPVRTDLPTGTVTFLRTDVEGSMTLARALGPRWDEVNAKHLGIIRRTVDAHGGICVRTEGDAFFGVFPEAGAAVTAAIEAQRALTAHAWPADGAVRVRMGLHSGAAHLAGDDFGGFEVNRAARIAAAGHGGQIVLSEPTRLLADAALTDGASVRDLGRHVLRDVPAPERLFQLDIPGLRSDFPPLRTSRPVAGNLPLRMTSFLGREREFDELRELLAANRLVTLTGPGGIGKTSLAIELARAHAETVADGAWFVPLDAVPDASRVPAAIASALGLFDGPDRPAGDRLPVYLAGRSILLVLDNFEHVIAAAAEVAGLLRASPGIRIVVTSRAALRLTGEQEYPVHPLERPDTCATLFQQRARAVRPGWEAGSDEGIVSEICALLDGLPLGMELAAARVSLLPVRAIRDRLAARLPLPGTGPRDAPDRQRTLDGAIAWSDDLLASDEQRLLHALAVFEGSFDLEQATAIDGDAALERLATLVEHSLVNREADDPGGGVRFRMLQTIRSFALDRLVEEGREPDVRRRHAEAYLLLTERASPFLPGADQAIWLERLARDDANLRSATRWAIDESETETALRLIAGLWRYWQLDGHLSEGWELTKAALTMPGAEAPTATRLAAVAAAGGIAYWQSEIDLAQRYYDEQLALAEALSDRAAAADATFNLVFTHNIGGDVEGALARLADVERRYRELGDTRGLAHVEGLRGMAALSSGDAAAAIPILEQVLGASGSKGDAWFHALGALMLGWAYWDTGDVTTGGRWILQSVAESRGMRDIAAMTLNLQNLAVYAVAKRSPEVAAALIGAFATLSQVYGVEPPSGLNYFVLTNNPIDTARAALGDEAYEEAFERGRRMTLDEALDLAYAIEAPA